MQLDIENTDERPAVKKKNRLFGNCYFDENENGSRLIMLKIYNTEIP